MRTAICILSCIGMLFGACNKKENKCFKGTGDVKTEQREIKGGFSEIRLHDNINLFIVQDSTSSLSIEAGENLLPFISSEISGNTLSLYNNNSCNFLRSYEVPVNAYLRVKNIDYIFMNGSGNVTSENAFHTGKLLMETEDASGSVNLNIQCDSFIIAQHTGPADFTIKGNTDYQYLYSGGNGWFYCKELIAEKSHVNSSGTGTAEVYAKKELTIELHLLGDIIYHGNPSTVNISTTEGTGNIIKR